VAAAAALDGTEEQVFVRGLLPRIAPGSQGLPQVYAEALSLGEQQLLLVLSSRGLAFPAGQDGRRHYLLDALLHQGLVESLSEPDPPYFEAELGPSFGFLPQARARVSHGLSVCHVLVSYYAIRPYVFECDLIVSAEAPEVLDSVE
jgi:hypothetical protein